jgi:hypothetical protein
MSYRHPFPCGPFGLTSVLALLAATATMWAQAPLAVDNLTDQSTHNLRVWFRVPSTSGCTYRVLLDDQPVPTDVTNWVESVDYHELSINRTNLADGTVTNRLVRFIVQSERGNPEKGLIRWTPYPVIDSTAAEFMGARLQIVTPAAYPIGLPIPVVAWVDDGQGRERRANGRVTAPGYESFAIQVRRGVGSGFLPPATDGGLISYAAQLHSLSQPKEIEIEPNTSWISASGVLSGSTHWPANSRIFIDAGLTVPAGSTLTIDAGTIVKLNPLVNITNSGRILINGSVTQPVVFTATNLVWPEKPAGAWGGFILRGSSAELVATGTILAGGGGAPDFDFSPGSSHRSEQAVLLLHSGARVALTNCYILNTAGQVGNGYNSDLTLEHCLFQRAITAGEYVGGTVVIRHSAIIEFPADDGVVDAQIADADYDAIYFTEGTHILTDSLVGFSMDDAIDSGSGGAGTVLVTNCWVESALHEALAWSGGGRTTWTYDTVTLNCGQGIECGWSTGDNSPNCFAERLLTTANSVGARVGDNYDWSYNGFLRLTNSLVLNNYRDVFLKTFNAVGTGWQTNSWVDRLPQVDFRGNWLTTAWTHQPDNRLWEPEADGWRLAHWMSTPPDAPVGIGFAVRTNRFAMAGLFEGVPVRLSSFTTNFVSVDYTFANSGTTLATGSLTFAPGETVKRIQPAGFDVSAESEVRVTLHRPLQGELTGETNVTFTGSFPRAQISGWVSTNALPLYRLAEGLLVKLSSPAGQVVSVDYSYADGGTVLTGGTLTFAPGETVRWVDPTGVDLAGRDSIQLSLGQPQGAPLSGITAVTYGAVPLQVAFALPAQQFDLSALAGGLPVGLNRATSNGVSVDFVCEASGHVLTNGTLGFDPGQTLQTLWLPTVNPDAHPLLQVRLSDARNAQLAAPSNLFFLRITTNPSPVLVASNSRWRYLDTGGDAGPAWRQLAYEDSGWSNGVAQLGFGDQDENTPIRQVGTNRQNTLTFYFRQQFEVEDPGIYTNLALWLLRDDGGVVYLNGAEGYRSPTLPPPPAVITFQTLANQLSVNDAPPDNSVDQANLSPTFLVAGTNVVAVEIHQHRTDSSDVSFDFALTGEPAPPPAPPILHWGRFAGQTVLVWGDPLFLLERANEVTGPWVRVSSAASPYVLDPGTGRVFYRLSR